MKRHTNPKIMSIRVIPEFSEESGFGNLIRSFELANEFSKFGPTELLVLTRFETRCRSIAPDDAKYEIKYYENPSLLIESVTSLDCAILDSPSPIAEEVAFKIKEKFPDSRVIALDYPTECAHFNLRISLFDQALQTFETTSKNHRVGLEFAIISEKIKSIPREERKREIVLKFSGSASGLLEKTAEIIQGVAAEFKYEVHVIDNRANQSRTAKFEEQAQFLNRLSDCSLYVGSGVTTLFESSLLETPTLFIGSNRAERQFAQAISRQYLVNTLDPKCSEFSDKLKSFIRTSLESKELEALIPRIGLDYAGAGRIVELAFQS